MRRMKPNYYFDLRRVKKNINISTKNIYAREKMFSLKTLISFLFSHFFRKTWAYEPTPYFRSRRAEIKKINLSPNAQRGRRDYFFQKPYFPFLFSPFVEKHASYKHNPSFSSTKCEYEYNKL